MSLSAINRLRAGALAGLSAAVLLLGACSNQPSTPAIAQAAPPTAGAPQPAPSVETSQDEIKKYVDSVRLYAKCARGIGVDVPDPDASGNLNGPPGAKPDPRKDPAKWKKLEACGKKLLPEPASLLYPDLTPAQFAKAKKYAVCMRAQGVPDYADPSVHTSPSPGASTASAADLKEISSHTYQKALGTCGLQVYGTAGQG